MLMSTTSVISSNPYQKSMVSPINPAAYLTHLKRKITNKNFTAASVTSYGEVKRALPAIKKSKEEIEFACKICQCSIDNEAKGDTSLTLMHIKKADLAYKAYGKWVHVQCEELMRSYENQLFQCINENEIIDKQAAYKKAFKVFEQILKPVPVKFRLEDKSETFRITTALTNALLEIEAFSNFELRNLVCSKLLLPAIPAARTTT